MPKNKVKFAHRSIAKEVKTRAQKQGSAPHLLVSKKDKIYTKQELEEINDRRRLRYNDLLTSARNDDKAAIIVFPTADQFEIPMARVSHSLQTRIELLDIYHYLERRKEDFPATLSPDNFGAALGIKLSRSACYNMLAREDELRGAAKTLPEGAHYIVKRRNLMLEQVLLHWLHDQRKKNVPVSGKLMKDAAHFACKVLCDLKDDSGSTVSEVPLSFSAWWFDSFRKHHRISYCQLHGEVGSVDLDAIEPELDRVRQLCAQYTPDNIFNCDETGMYVKELDTKFYTTPLSKAGAKAFRDCKVSVLFCINASGTSLALSKTMPSLRPLVIGEHIPRDVGKAAASRMTMRKTAKGWMTADIFVPWLQQFDAELTQPTLLLLDSAGAHSNIDKLPWTHLHIQRLPLNSTAVTQPLDAGVISTFKRAFLEILGREMYHARNFTATPSISNGLAWKLIPDAWDEIKPSTLRNCFAKTPILPTEMREALRQQRPTKNELQSKPQHTRGEKYKEQEKAYFQHIIAEIGGGNILDFRVEESKDEEGGGQGSVGGDQTSIGESSSREDPGSSPIADTDIYATIETLEHLVGDSDVLGIKRVRQSAERDQGKREVRKAVKHIMRACAVVREEDLVKEDASGHE